MNNMLNLSQWTNPSNNSKSPGQGPGTCFGLYDLGTHNGEYKGNGTQARKLMTQVECHAHDGSVLVLSQIFTSSIHPKSMLRKFLDGWNGEKFCRETIKEIGPEWVLGRTGIFTWGYANNYDDRLTIKSAAPIGDVKAPALSRPIAVFSLDSPDLAVFSKLSTGVQAMIQKSPEWKALPYADDWVRHYVSQQTTGNAPF